MIRVRSLVSLCQEILSHGLTADRWRQLNEMVGSSSVDEMISIESKENDYGTIAAIDFFSENESRVARFWVSHRVVNGRCKMKISALCTNGHDRTKEVTGTWKRPSELKVSCSRKTKPDPPSNSTQC